jgi:hypothetical protein
LEFRKKCQEFVRTVVTISLVMLSNRATNGFTNHQMLDVASRRLRIFTIMTCTHDVFARTFDQTDPISVPSFGHCSGRLTDQEVQLY